MTVRKSDRRPSRSAEHERAASIDPRVPQLKANVPEKRVPWQSIFLGVVILASTLVVYLPVMKHGGFVWDDDDYVTENETLRSIDGLRRIWIPGETTQYYPAVYTSFWLEYHLWGLNPTGYHVVNVLLQGLGAILLWRVLLRLSVRGAWLAALIFALHPVHVESVAWITERKNVLSGVFVFATLLAYCRFQTFNRAADRTRNSWLHYGAALVFFLLALLSKTVVCTLPAAIGLLLWWRGRLTMRSAAALLPMFVIGAVFAMVTAKLELHEVGAQGAEWSLTVLERFLLAGRVLWFYLGKLVWPVNVNLIYYRWAVDALVWWQYLFPLGFFGAVAMLWALRGKIGKGALVAALYFAGTLVPALGFFNVYFMRYSYVADHFQYLASVGPIAAIAFILTRYAERFRKPAGSMRGDRGATSAPATGGKGSPKNSHPNLLLRFSPVGHLPIAVLLVALALITWNQGKAYESVESLWRDTLSKNDHAWIAHGNLANELMDQQKYKDAETHLARALELKPDYAEAYQSMGMVHAHRGEFDEAVRCFKKRLELKGPSPSSLTNLAMALAQSGEEDRAAEYFSQALQLSSSFGDAHYGLGLLLAKRGEADEAARHLRLAIQSNPANADAHYSLGVLLAREGKFTEAASLFRQTLQYAPNHVDAKRALIRLGERANNASKP